MRTVLTCTLVAALLQQAPPRDSAAPPPTREGTGVIKGRVYDRESGAPVPNAMVTLATDIASLREALPSGAPAAIRAPQPRQAKTDAQGRYTFERLPAGTYNLSSNPPEFRVTYLPQSYGAPRPHDPTRPSPRRPLPLGEGQTLDNIDLPLWRSLAITGHVADEFGEPLAGVPIVVTAAGTNRNVAMRGPYGFTTDDRGSFRLFGLAPGRYVVCATPQNGMFRGGDDPTERYMKTCAPNAGSESEGQVVELTATDYGEVEIRMTRGRAYKITGTALDSQGKPVNQVSIVRTEGTGMSSSGGQTDGTGHFTFNSVVPGDYTIVAQVGNNGMMPPAAGPEREVGGVAVHVDGADVENVVVTTTKGVSAAGRLVFEGGTPPAVKGLRVMLRPQRGSPTVMMGPPPNAEVLPDLTFTLNGLFGAYGVAVSGLPGGWIVKNVRLGNDDVTDRPVEFHAKDRLEVVLSNRPAVLAGRVVTGQGEVATDYRVLLFPAERERWTMLTGSPSTLPRTDGTFKLGSIPPGEYFLAVVRIEDMPSFGEQATYERLAKIAQRLTLLDDETKEIELTIPR
ncbi:MAG TPA: carboxypeptidase-like regulatory domain-containing protein [Acidimicrobiales bacterium]|nr:carboxypeptidase-like regulatory domain-containing protein [Acidimicrobiales bacterium]